MDFVLPTPSLQHVAAVKIVSHLWNGRDILARVSQLVKSQPRCVTFALHMVARHKESKEWKEIEGKVASKVSALLIPEPLTAQLLNIIKPLGIEILGCWRFHNEMDNCFQCLGISLPDEMCWTMHGAIDYKKSIELMLKDQRVDVDKRFKLACANCLEPAARELFRNMNEEKRQEFIRESVKKLQSPTLIIYFTRLINGYQIQPSDPGLVYQSSTNIWLFENTLRSGHRALSECSFAKLEQWEKDRVLEDYEKYLYHCTHESISPSCYLLGYLSLMNEEQLRCVFRRLIYDILECLLRWPMQSLFMDTASCWWDCMDTAAFVKVLCAILGKILQGFRDFDYFQLFWECWRLSSAEYKHHFLQQDNALKRVLQSKREEFIQLILNKAPAQQIEKLLRR